jgi:hypothetical protein
VVTGNKDRVYKIGGYDVSKYVLQDNFIYGIQNKPEWGDLPQVPRLELQLDNSKNIFGNVGSRSIFNNLIMQDLEVEVIRLDGSLETTEWKGFVENNVVNHDNNRVKITGMSGLSKWLDNTALLTTGEKTPAELSKDVFTAFGIDVDDQSYNESISLQTGLLSVRLDPNLLESRITLYEVQKQLATAGHGRIYFKDGKMVYDTYNDDINITTSIDLGERDLMTNPQEAVEERKDQKYTVEYLFGNEPSFGFVSGGSAQTLNFGPNSPVKVMSQAAASNLADQWERIDKIKSKRLSFAVKHDVGFLLDLGSYITLTWKRIGLSLETLEIISIDRTDPKYTKLITRSLPL